MISFWSIWRNQLHSNTYLVNIILSVNADMAWDFEHIRPNPEDKALWCWQYRTQYLHSIFHVI